MTTDTTCTEIAVVGTGPSGLAAAIAIASKGLRVRLLGPALDPKAALGTDQRTTAVLGDGIAFLDNLGVWPSLASVSAPLEAIRIVDDRGGLIRAPEVLFTARELGRDAFGFNVPNEPLRAALLARALALHAVSVIETGAVVAVTPDGDGVTVATAEGRAFRCRLLVAADGRKSIARQAAGIAARQWSYPQVAIATSFGHTRPHHGVSTEFHRRAGPLTTVPLPDDPGGPCSSLVWVESPEEARRLMDLDDARFAVQLTERLQGLSGRIRWTGSRGTFPLAGLIANPLAKARIALLGEAAHVLPPIGAQGLNLGFRDAAALADRVASAEDPGAAAVLDGYARDRAGDLLSREIGIDTLNRALLSDFPPVQAFRSLGLFALARASGLRRLLMGAGLAPPGRVSSLMRARRDQEPAAPGGERARSTPL